MLAGGVPLDVLALVPSDGACPRQALPPGRVGVEEKVDGWRIVAIKEGRHVCLMSRTGKDHAARFPDIARAVAELPTRTAIIDGEVAVFDADLISRFHFLNDPPPADVTVTPLTYIAFDAIQVGTRDLRRRPLGDRRGELEELIAKSDILPARRLPDDGLKAWALVQERRWRYFAAENNEQRLARLVHG